ncbi:MAG: glycosyltransferase [Desulfobacterales bacterium]
MPLKSESIDQKMKNHIRSQEKLLCELKGRVKDFEIQDQKHTIERLTFEKKKQSIEIDQLAIQVNGILSSNTWKIAQFFQKLSVTLLPLCSRRRIFAGHVKKFIMDFARSLRVLNFSPSSGALKTGDNATIPIAPDSPAENWNMENAHNSQAALFDYREKCISLLYEHLDKKLPKISIVSVLYNKEREVSFFLESVLRQSYPGEFEIILVDDCAIDHSVPVAEGFFNNAAKSAEYTRIPKWTILKNDVNCGNCSSRNIGVKKAEGDIVVIIDADCVINADFLLFHALAFSYGDCDAAIGPFNIETGMEDPLEVLTRFELEPSMALREQNLQDKINTSSFLNCITRNFSIKREFIQEEELFDTLFSYSLDPASGFGWEDVEMGYRLYNRGARIKFIPQAFSLHISHPPGEGENRMVCRSMLNFRRLFEKHPDLALISRRWTMHTYQEISEWMTRCGVEENNDHKTVRHIFKDMLPYPFQVRRSKKLRILTYRWHCSHQYELYKLPHEFTLVSGLITEFAHEWDFEHRPLPENAVFKHLREINPDEYDLAVLHFDENILAPENTNNVIGPDWGINFRFFKENFNLPMIAVCHGTPQFYGQYDALYDGPDLMTEIESERKQIVDYLGDILVICNSHQAEKEWGFNQSKVIWHGFDPTEFFPSVYEKGILSLGKNMRERAHYRGYHLYQKVMENFPEQYMPGSIPPHDPDPRYPKKTNAYAAAKFRNYVDAIRKFSIYFNPTLRSPMPRCRGEAMMCGLALVCADNHDVNMFLDNGINGFYSNDPEELRDILLSLAKNPAIAKKIGMAGRRLAMDIFNHDRYLKEWETAINQIVS